MATQGQRRQQAIQAMRALRRAYRKVDTAGERVERELDRLIKRKTLIQYESLLTTAKEIDSYAVNMNGLVNMYIDTVNVILAIPV